MKKDDWNIKGQMDIFDFLKPEKDEVAAEPDFDTMTIEEAVDIIQNRTGLKFTKYDEHFKGHYMAKRKGYVIQIGFSHFAHGIFDGRRFLDVQIDKGTWGCGRPCISIDEAVEAIELNTNKCEHSGHCCNKEELWKIAESLDEPFCPHVCCRFCSTKLCGARCNGSEEPKEAKEQAIDSEATCSMAAECEAYKNGCNGTIEPCTFDGPYKWNAMNEPQPREVVVKGFMDDGYCPNCDGCLEDLVKECKYCGQLLSWEHWKVINDYTEEAND